VAPVEPTANADAGAADPGRRTVGGRYELGPVLGRGASAVVYRARDLHERVAVAVKLLHHTSASAEVRRQQDEVAVLAKLRHPGLVQLRDAGTEQGRLFVVTDLADGPTLAARIRTGPPLRPPALHRLGRRLADALAYVHGCGVVHRDVKPSNILLHRGLRPRLADFGIAHVLDRTATTAGVILGTAAYLAPEQVRGEPVTPATDVYALGLVLLEAATGRREYPGRQIEAATARLRRPPQMPQQLPADLTALLRSMTLDDPDQRPTAATVAAALTPWWGVTRSRERQGRHRLTELP
jgi:serine/threonine protein kinase